MSIITDTDFPVVDRSHCIGRLPFVLSANIMYFGNVITLRRVKILFKKMCNINENREGGSLVFSMFKLCLNFFIFLFFYILFFFPTIDIIIVDRIVTVQTFLG